MTPKKLRLEQEIPKRTALAREFILAQNVVPADRKELRVQLHAFAKKVKQSILRSDELLRALATLPHVSESQRAAWRVLFQKRSIRSASGVSVLAILTRNFGCPGKCVYCPTPANMPKSYLPSEPAVLRAIAARFSPSLQVRRRLKALKATGHDPSKVELIVMGGTWSALPHHYQTQFIRACYHALNGKGGRMLSLLQEQKRNETAPHRCVGLTLETRPDWITVDEIRRMRMFGCTRVELGVQTLDDRVYILTKRGHTVQDVVRATALLRDAGIKVVYHMMFNLPGATPEDDISHIRQLFADPRFRPDQIKIYPCVLVADCELVDWYKRGDWKPYTDEQLAETIIAAKKYIPEYCRVIRVIRDIPSDDIIAGSKISNLRQVLQNRGMYCRCIRCREIRGKTIGQLELMTRTFDAAHGKEIFLSYEDLTQDKIVALLRLRIPSWDQKNPFQKIYPALQYAAIVRELHVYGVHTPVGAEGTSAQHLGLGKKLVREAEKIAREHHAKKLAVISGLGVRDYYRALGYHLQDGYMVKGISAER